MEWRQVERVLVEAFRREGYKISQAGDTFASVSGACQMATIGEARCRGIGPQSINITTIAKEIAP